MKLDTLLVRHEQEINTYIQERAKRLFELQKSQNEIIGNCLVLDKKTRKAVENLLVKQRQTWEKMEKDEIDLLLHLQAQEKESVMKEEEKRLRLIELLGSKSDRDKDRGR